MKGARKFLGGHGPLAPVETLLNMGVIKGMTHLTFLQHRPLLTLKDGTPGFNCLLKPSEPFVIIHSGVNNRDAGEGARGEQAPLLPFLKGARGSEVPFLNCFYFVISYCISA